MEGKDIKAEIKRIGDIAMDLYNQGLCIIPLQHPWSSPDGDGKKPLREFAWSQYQQKMPNLRDIERWFIETKECVNIGVVCGPISNLVVVDIDSHEARKEVAKTDWPDPEAVVCTAKGEHWYYGWSDEYPIGNRSKLTLGSGGTKLAIDVRGSGGYVVGPGSRHSSGAVYKLVHDGKVKLGSLPDVPTEIAKDIQAPRRSNPTVQADRIDDEQEIQFRLTHIASAKTRMLLKEGCAAGDRNERAYRAARDLNGLGIPQERTHDLLLKSPMGLKEREVRTIVKSAYSKPAYPAVFYAMLNEQDVQAAAEEMRKPPPAMKTPPIEQQQDAPVRDKPLDPSDKTPLPSANDLRTATGRPVRISNVESFERTTEDNETENVRVHRHMESIRKDVVDGLAGWPKSAGGVLFAIKHDPDGENGWDGRKLAKHSDVWWLTNESQLFSYLHTVGDGVMWHQGMVRASRTDPDPVTAVTKNEFYHRLCSAPGSRHDGIEILPHYPRIKGVFYLTPKIDEPDKKLTTWRKFIEMFNPATDVDRKLLAAATLTPMWGGLAGSRPAFLISSDYGRGAGKTATAQAIAEVYGGAVEAGQSRDQNPNPSKSLVSPEGMTKRCVIWDNLKGRQDYAAIESMITAPTIQEHRLYVGHSSRPNYITWFLTANSAEASNDLAQRCIIIKIGKQQHHRDFIGEVKRFIDENREKLLSEIMYILSSPSKWTLPDTKADRWQAWTRGVLEKIEGGDECLETIGHRRLAIDVDREDSQWIVDMIVELIYKNGAYDACILTGKYTFATQDLYEVAMKHGKSGMDVRAFGRWIARKIADGELVKLTKYDGLIGPSGQRKKIKGYTIELSRDEMKKLLEGGSGDERQDLFKQAQAEFKSTEG